MVGWHHRLSGHEFEQALGDGEGQGSLVCCSPWGRRVGHDQASEQPQQEPSVDGPSLPPKHTAWGAHPHHPEVPTPKTSWQCATSEDDLNTL